MGDVSSHGGLTQDAGTTPDVLPIDLELVELALRARQGAKVEIINLMANLDPVGDWQGQGMPALQTCQSTVSGEYPLEHLLGFRDSLERAGKLAPCFMKLKNAVDLKPLTEAPGSFGSTSGININREQKRNMI